MKKKLLLNYNTSKLRVCVDSVADRIISGWVLSQRLTEPIEFNDLSDLVLQLEKLMDTQNYPQSFQRKRSFRSAPHTVLPRKNAVKPLPAPIIREDKGDAKLYMAEADVNAARGKVLTFILHVLSRQHSGWQGYVSFLNDPQSKTAEYGEKENLNFDSVLEFFSIVNKILEKF